MHNIVSSMSQLCPALEQRQLQMLVRTGKITTVAQLAGKSLMVLTSAGPGESTRQQCVPCVQVGSLAAQVLHVLPS